MTMSAEYPLLESPASCVVPLLESLANPPEPSSERSAAGPVVVLVDDDWSFLSMVKLSLVPYCDSWRVNVFSDPEKAWEFIRDMQVDAVVTDLTMPRMSGFELLRRIRGHAVTHDIPVTILTGAADGDLKHDALDLGATDLLGKPFHTAELVARLRSMLRLKFMQDAMKRRGHQLEDLVASRTQELSHSRLQIIWKLAKAAEFRDEETGEHVVRVAQSSAQIARQLQLPQAFVEAIYLAAPLHDIGKIGIPDSILLKPGKLTTKEQMIMRQHCELGFKILSEPGRAEMSLQAIPSLGEALVPDAAMRIAQEVALSHHECWDGSGYPRGLVGEDIPLCARIVAVADVYDALRSTRPYKFPLSAEDATRIIEQGRGRQFDPQVVDAFLQCHHASTPNEQVDAQRVNLLPDTAEMIRHFDTHAVGR